ncbi:MAG: tRNA pseudouridine55 synthase [Mycobacterium sp.]|nr:tRNA pseudouridine55 synthase [Mycobacterium sp.]
MRRALHTKRIGHTGTLDPLATGVLPLVIGRATRLASLLSGAEKEYVAGVRLGRATDTYDAAGLVGPPPAPPAGIDFARIDGALDRFRGIFDQAPPSYSAKKIDGVAAYKLARRNTPVQPRPVSVNVTRLSLEAYEHGRARVRVSASAGFYVRSLAHDLGSDLGCGAYLEALRRVRAGTFSEGSATPLEEIEREGPGAARLIIPLERLLPEVPAVVLNERGVRRAAHGNELALEDLVEPPPPVRVAIDGPNQGRWRLLDGAGMLLAVAESRPGGLLHPVIVLV